MAYCSKCGKELAEGENYCPACGSPVGGSNDTRPEQTYAPYKQEETGAFAWGILSFILTMFTVIGGIVLCIILFATGKPKGGTAALIGMLLAIAVGIAVVVFFIVLGASSINIDSIIQMIC